MWALVNVRGCIASRRRSWVLAALLHCAACGKTPVDAIVHELDGSSADAGDDPCLQGVSVAVAGQFRLRAVASGDCLAVGESTTVLGNPAFSSQMVDDCAVAGEIWQLIPVLAGSNVGAFEVRSTTLFGNNLDIEMAQVEDFTAAILFQATSLANQRFFFRPRRQAVLELAPAHVMARTSCLSSAPPTPTIARCSSAATDQEWQLLPTDCK